MTEALETQAEPTSTPTETPTRKPRGVRPKKKEARALEQLHDAPTRSMTDVEMRKYIEFLREENSDLRGSVRMLEKNCQSAYEKIRHLDEQSKEIKHKALVKLEFAKQSIKTCAQAVILAGGLED